MAITTDEVMEIKESVIREIKNERAVLTCVHIVAELIKAMPQPATGEGVISFYSQALADRDSYARIIAATVRVIPEGYAKNAAPGTPLQTLISDVLEGESHKITIDVEKRLCDILEIPWSAAGMSIETLCADLKKLTTLAIEAIELFADYTEGKVPPATFIEKMRAIATENGT